MDAGAWYYLGKSKGGDKQVIIGITIIIAGPLLIYWMWKEASKDSIVRYTTLQLLAALTSALSFAILGIIIMYYELGWLVPAW